MKKGLLIYNPVSGNHFVSGNLDTIISEFRKLGVILEIYRISEEDTIIGHIADSKADFIIGAGGDGTIGQVIASMLKQGVNLPFMALGTGTCNNFTRSIDETRLILSTEHLAKVIRESYLGVVEKLDVGLVNDDRIFLTSLAGGNFVDTSFATDKSLKQMLGPLAYYIKPLTELGNIKHYPVHITADDAVYDEDILMFLLLNGKSVGTFDRLIHEADMSDGMMELVLIKEAITVESLALLRAMLLGEDIKNYPNVKILKGKHFAIESKESIPIAIDGEAGPKLPLRVEVLPQAVRVMTSRKPIKNKEEP